LSPMMKLKSVDVYGTRVTGGGKQRLKQSLPAINIFGP
jgi:hypothetical protein